MIYSPIFKLVAILSTLCMISATSLADIIVPANTGYTTPDPNSLRFDKAGTVHGWAGTETTITWYGEFKQVGALNVKLDLVLPPDHESKLKLTIANQSRVVSLSQQNATADFGTFSIDAAGYQAISLESLNDNGGANGSLKSLQLSGAAAVDAHFNLKPRRNAASVHLAYPVAKGSQVSAFYCEMTGFEDPIWTYYMACGWHRGYFGMQVNSETERRIIFSVWDSGGEAIDRGKVEDENRVQLVAKGRGVYSGDFGNEGTGGHSHLKYQWKTGEKQRFLVTAEPVDATHTIFAGYYFRPDLNEWMLISSWKAPKEGGRLRGLYSFSENFVGSNGQVLRKARYGNQWIRDAAGTWTELTTATFSHDGTGREDRLDRYMGLENDEFFLSHGGFVNGFTRYGEPFNRPHSKLSPAQMQLPKLPPISEAN